MENWDESLNANPVNAESALNLSFNRSFKILLTAIILLQTFELTILLSFSESLLTPLHSELTTQYYLYQIIGGFVWFILLTTLVFYDFKRSGVIPAIILNIKFSVLKSNMKRVLFYFSIMSFAVVSLSFLSSESELGLEKMQGHIILLTFFSVVIVAPVCEEIIFRGYLYTAMIPVFKRNRERNTVNALFFAGAHVFLILFFIGADIPYYIFVLGFLLAKLYYESQSVLPPILLHSLNNLLVFTIDLFKANYI